MIQDNGVRREFSSGAVRDVAEGKGRCDLLPLEIVGEYLQDNILYLIERFQRTGDTDYLYRAIQEFTPKFNDKYTMILEVAKHYEEGANKYAERNWEKGIPSHCYIDSAVRHYLKFKRGDDDERHDRAFVWNLLCCIWTMRNREEMIEYPLDTHSETTENVKEWTDKLAELRVKTEAVKNDTLDGCNR